MGAGFARKLFIAVVVFETNKSYCLVGYCIDQSVFISNSTRKLPLQIVFEWLGFASAFKWRSPDFFNHFGNFEKYLFILSSPFDKLFKGFWFK